MSKNRTRFFVRVLSLLLVFSFTLSEVVRLAPAEAFQGETIIGNDPAHLVLPAEWGELKEIRKGPASSPLLIHIQDAHANMSGQENIARLLESIFARYGNVPVLVEGGTKDDSLTSIKSLATPAAWKKAARKFLLEGKISGEEYLNLTSDRPMRILGVEDKPLYRKGLEAYADLAQSREEALARIKRLRAAAAVVKRTVYSKDLLKMDEACEVEGQVTDCVKQLGEGWRVKGKGEHNNLEIFQSALAKEKNVDFDATRLEQAAVAEKIGKTFPAVTSVASLTGQLAQFSAFVEAAEKSGVHLTDYPALSAYRDYLESFRAIDFGLLIDEIAQAAEARFVAENENVRLLHSVDRHLDLLEKAHEIRMSSSEAAQLTESAGDFTETAMEAYLNRQLAERGSFRDLMPASDRLTQAAPLVDAFYRSASERDEAFVRNAEKWMTSEKASVAVLIAGGYHTESLKKRFQEKNWSYAVVTPKVTSETIQEKYERILLEPLGKERGLPPSLHSNSNPTVASSPKGAGPITQTSDASTQSGIVAVPISESGARLAALIAEAKSYSGLITRVNEVATPARRRFNGGKQSLDSAARLAEKDVNGEAGRSSFKDQEKRSLSLPRKEVCGAMEPVATQNSV